jgi:hypothetical protein
VRPQRSDLRLLLLLLASALVASPVSTTSFPTDLSPELQDVLERYQAATKLQHEAMRGVKMDMMITGRFSKLREKGQMEVSGTISKLGEMTFSNIVFSGDNRVKTQLISRYLEQEQKARLGVMSLSPEEYEFKIVAILKQDQRQTYVFEVKPRKKGTDKLRGEVWIDGATGMPLRESGVLSQAPHLVLTKPHISRDYELRDGISVITHFRTSTDVLLPGVGTAELDVNFSNFSRISAEQSQERL